MADNDINMLDLPVAPNLGGLESVWIVQGGTDRRTTTAAIAGLASSGFVVNTTVVESGSSYTVQPSDTFIIVDKTVGSATTINLLPSADKVGFVYIKDGKGDAGTNNITITAAGSDTMDGLGSVTISTNYGLLAVLPNPLGGWVIVIFG
jgi:hypothetical protein